MIWIFSELWTRIFRDSMNNRRPFIVTMYVWPFKILDLRRHHPYKYLEPNVGSTTGHGYYPHIGRTVDGGLTPVLHVSSLLVSPPPPVAVTRSLLGAIFGGRRCAGDTAGGCFGQRFSKAFSRRAFQKRHSIPQTLRAIQSCVSRPRIVMIRDMLFSKNQPQSILCDY